MKTTAQLNPLKPSLMRALDVMSMQTYKLSDVLTYRLLNLVKVKVPLNQGLMHLRAALNQVT